MKLIDRHVLFQCLQTFFMALCAFVGLLLLQNVYDNLKDLIDMGVGFSGILYYYAMLMPGYLPSILPLVFMISVLFSLGQLHRNSEIVAMKACGLGIWRITRSIWVLGAALALLLFFLNSKIVPWTVEEARSIWDSYSYSSQLEDNDADDVGLVRAMAYNNYRKGRLWFINRFSQYNYRAFGIMVSELDGERGEKERIVADEGYYDEKNASWVFLNGRIVNFDPVTRDIVRSTPFRQREFREFTESPLSMQLREKRAKDLSFHELGQVLEEMPRVGDPDRNSYLVRYYSMALSPLICLLVVGISVPFATTGVRVNPMVGLSKAMGLFFLYYALSSVSTMLGSQGRLLPFLAALLPPVCAVFLAVWLARRARFS